MGIVKKPKITEKEKWKNLLEQIEAIKKTINEDRETIIAIDGKNYTFQDFTEMVLTAVKERETETE
jgi:heme oxygenase